MAKIDGVAFEFFAKASRLADAYDCSVGSVDHEPGRMVLEVPLPGDRPYVIVGHQQQDGSFTGRHEGDPDDIEVSAIWAKVGDRYLGTWKEEEDFYVFSFLLPAM